VVETIRARAGEPASFADDGSAWSPDGTHLVQLTSKERNSWSAWSPDGTKIIFAYRSTTVVDQNAHLYEMNSDGSVLVQITKNDFWQLPSV
jgi:Tol biopolymer transport system component